MVVFERGVHKLIQRLFTNLELPAFCDSVASSNMMYIMCQQVCTLHRRSNSPLKLNKLQTIPCNKSNGSFESLMSVPWKHSISRFHQLS